VMWSKLLSRMSASS
jgi:hypothetical protein